MNQQTINTVVEEIVRVMVEADISTAEAIAIVEALNEVVRETADEPANSIILP